MKNVDLYDNIIGRKVYIPLRHINDPYKNQMVPKTNVIRKDCLFLSKLDFLRPLFAFG